MMEILLGIFIYWIATKLDESITEAKDEILAAIEEKRIDDEKI